MAILNFKPIVQIILCTLLTTISVFSSGRDPADKQLQTWSKSHKKVPAHGVNYSPENSLTGTVGVGSKGPLLMRALTFEAYLNNIANDAIPERAVHANGAGAKGYFIVTHPMTAYTKATVFSKIGLKTPVVVRFSTIAGNTGSADTVLDMRGFAIKFKTTEGIYDLMLTNVPVFPIRDAAQFPHVSHSRARNPRTHAADPNMYFDYTSNRPESTFNVFLMHSNLTFFKNYRHIEGFGVNAFMWTGGTIKTNVHYFVRYHMRPDRKPVTSSLQGFIRQAGIDKDYMKRDLYNSIALKKYLRFTLFGQIFTDEDARKSKYNMFDSTKMLFESDYPLVPIGKLVLNKNPTDFFNDVNQAAFSPGNLVPGIEFGYDRLLQGRPFAYLHAQIHRLGSNYYHLPINRPIGKVKGQSYLRNGFMNIDGNGNGGPAYYPNSFNGPYMQPKSELKPFKVDGGRLDVYDAQHGDNYFQIDRYWREILSAKQRRETIETLATHLAGATKKVQKRSLKVNWDPINDEVKTMMRAALSKATARLNRKKKKSTTKSKSCVKKLVDDSKMSCNRTKISTKKNFY